MSRAIIWRKEEENEKYFSNQIKLLTESISAAFSQENPSFIPRLWDAVLWSWLPVRALHTGSGPRSAGGKISPHPAVPPEATDLAHSALTATLRSPRFQGGIYGPLTLCLVPPRNRHTKETQPGWREERRARGRSEEGLPTPKPRPLQAGRPRAPPWAALVWQRPHGCPQAFLLHSPAHPTTPLLLPPPAANQISHTIPFPARLQAASFAPDGISWPCTHYLLCLQQKLHNGRNWA